MSDLIKSDAYNETFKRILHYINANLDGDLSVETLSCVANFSKFHFHRQFSLTMGITVAKYIQLLRLKRASIQLVFNPQIRVIDIALNAGFENPETFSRAFKQTFAQSPSEFRKAPEWESWNEIVNRVPNHRRVNVDVKIIQFEQQYVAALEHRSAPERVYESAARFIEWRNASGLSPVKRSKTFGIAYDDPKTTLPGDFRFDICGSVKGDRIPENEQGVIVKVIPAGKCAVGRHHGSHDDIGDSVNWLFSDWLPDSGERLRDFPVFFHYLNIASEVPEHELITDIHLPLE